MVLDDGCAGQVLCCKGLLKALCAIGLVAGNTLLTFHMVSAVVGDAAWVDRVLDEAEETSTLLEGQSIMQG